METTFIAQLWSGIEAFFASINWLFVVLFIVVMWLLNEGTDSVHPSTNWLNWLQVIPKAWRTFIGGLFLATAYAFLYDMKAKVDYAGLIYSVLLGMIVWKLGINQFFEWLKQKIWFGNKPTPTAPTSL